MGVGLVGRSFGGNMSLANKVAHKKAKGNNFGVCCKDSDLRTMHRCR